MQAWRIAQGNSGTLESVRLAVPQPAAGEVLIQVAHAGINRADLFQRQGSYPAPVETQHVPGLEASGEVVALGADLEGVRVGDKVCALLIGGGYAEYCTAPATQLLPIPPSLTSQEAAGLPEALATGWLTLVETAHLHKGESVLIHGGSSGIGMIAIQIARFLGASVITTAGSPEKCRACEALGATAIHYHTQDFLREVKNMTAGRGVDVILDMVGGTYAERNLRTLAPRGRLISIALLGGAETTLTLGGLLMKNLSWHGITLRSRTAAEKASTLLQLRQNLWTPLLSGQIKPVIDRVYPFAEVEKAHLRMQEGLHIGKIILSM